MSSLSIGIVGLPNVGKSTLFNALLKRQAALAANYPFATIEPNIGVVDVPDHRLEELCKIVINDYGRGSEGRDIPEKVTPAVVKFYDIAGLVKGASKGEGLGNAFLGHIREVSAIAHVVRSFEDENVVRAGSIDPVSDKETINTELLLSDIQSLENTIGKLEKEVRGSTDKEIKLKHETAKKILEGLNKGVLATDLGLSEEELEASKELNLLTLKPQILVLNVSEQYLSNKNIQNIDKSLEESIIICAKLEADLADFDKNERENYLKELGIEYSGLDKLIKKGYEILGLETFLTAGPKEVRAWTIKKGTKAPQAAGEIHTDFERGFISAEIINFETLLEIGSLKKAKEKGLVRLEGKNYEMHDGDVVLFRFSV
ncbi:redox-regulated ATPase YchF [Patescibacteria group bacterium]|nr:redox-regulated ATPase YchF [Patescibacteria group bacterium]